MRVSAQTKAATRERILKATLRLLAETGYDATTTRSIAEAAEIASGTLFNYFPTKEAIIASLASEAINQALAETDAGSGGGDALEEDLFAVIALGLRKLKPLRKYLPALMETSLSPLAVAAHNDSSSLRLLHLEAVAALVVKHGRGPLSSTALQLYWTLYTGVLMFWANDESPEQEDTLALIDDSLNMFVGWLCGDQGVDPAPHKQ
jgi:AcrR family transcriptional regulator